MDDTTFADKIKSDNILAFNGIPGKVSSLDITVEDVCTEYDYPVHYGGTVLGSIRKGFCYVEPGTTGSASNYHFGTRMCSAITECGGRTTEKAAVQNLTAESDLTCTLTVPQSRENDEIEASLELKRFKWNLSHKDAVPFSMFRTYSQSLAVRSGYDQWKQRMLLIVQCIEPTALRNSLKFWFECRITVNKWINAHPAQPTVIDLTKCEKCGGYHDTEKFRKNVKGSKTTVLSSRTDAVCDWCNKPGHYKNKCLRLRGQITRGEVPAEERNRRRGPPAAAPAARPPAQQRSFLSRAGKPGGQYKPYTCRTCGGAGHSASVCPTRSTTTSAATKLVDNNKRDDSPNDSNPALYFMEAWTPGPTSLGKERMAMSVCDDEHIDELFSTRYADQLVDFPVFNNITSPTDAVEVI
ncbi:hypothetical protein EDC01DRAFT_636034 [Geopyxis carbonaria]|nr:hypothetical protein EDC01DRAFT_636034 [Geopyxis carbonaria]